MPHRRLFTQQAKLTVRLEALRAALAREKSDRLALWDQRNSLSQRLGELKTRTSKSRETERDVMARLSERIKEGLEAVEKTVAMTGLDVDDLIDGAFGPNLDHNMIRSERVGYTSSEAFPRILNTPS